jgi:SAM-dependent methyltransferase
VDLDALASMIGGLGTFTNVIEVGCGDGALLTRLMNMLPAEANAVGTDIAARPGQGYIGRNPHVEFRQATVADIVAEGRQFDLVVVSDVLHHIPRVDRHEFLESCRKLVAPDGTFVVKEWVRRRNVAHLAAYVSDRYISGDRGVQFYTEGEFSMAVTGGAESDVSRTVPRCVPPRRNNVLVSVRNDCPEFTASPHPSI